MSRPANLLNAKLLKHPGIEDSQGAIEFSGRPRHVTCYEQKPLDATGTQLGKCIARRMGIINASRDDVWSGYESRALHR